MELLGLVEIPTTILLLVTSMLLLYVYLTWTYSTWSSLGIAGPKPIAILGTTLRNFQVGSIKAIQENYAIYKEHRVYGAYTGRSPVLVILDIEIMKKILVKEFTFFQNRRPVLFEDPLGKMLTGLRDDEWKHVRSVISPTFSSGKIKHMVAPMNDCADLWMEKLGQKADSGEIFEFKELCSKFTLDIIGRVAFGIKTNVQNDDNVEFVQHADNFVNFRKSIVAIFVTAMFVPTLLPLMKKLGLMKLLPQNAIEYFDEIMNQAIEARTSNSARDTNFLQLMLKAKNEQDDDDGKQGIDNATILANTVLFFVAGFDTVSSTIAWVAYNLALNPDAQEKLYEEISNTIGDEKEITFEALSQMTYLDMVIDESLRLYPIAFMLERQCKQTIEVDGITIPKDVIVYIPVYALHHDADIYPDPEEFTPERMSAEEKAKRNPFHYMPFGHGPRNCVGMRFAQTEVRLAVAKLVQNFKIIRCEKTEVPITLKKIGQMHAKNGIHLTVEKRN